MIYQLNCGASALGVGKTIKYKRYKKILRDNCLNDY